MKKYGVRGPDPRNTVATVPSRAAALEMRMHGDVLMVKDGTCPHTNECHCPGSWRDTATCKNCGQEITTWHPYPMRLPREWTHIFDGSVMDGTWHCFDGSGNHAEPEER